MRRSGRQCSRPYGYIPVVMNYVIFSLGLFVSPLAQSWACCTSQRGHDIGFGAQRSTRLRPTLCVPRPPPLLGPRRTVRHCPRRGQKGRRISHQIKLHIQHHRGNTTMTSCSLIPILIRLHNFLALSVPNPSVKMTLSITVSQ